MPGTPGGIAYDPVLGKAYICSEHDHAETVIVLAPNTAKSPVDPAPDMVTGRTPVPDCAGNHGLYVDGTKNLAFIACEGSA